MRKKTRLRRKPAKRKTLPHQSTPNNIQRNDIQIDYVARVDDEFSKYFDFAAKFTAANPIALAETSQLQSDSESDSDDSISKPLTSYKKLAKQSRPTVAQLKQMVKNPDLVDWVDVTAPDPLLTVHLKSCRNTVQIPAHWSLKRKYLQAKRGVLKKPFELPDFIKQTGITEMRGDVNASQKINTRYIKLGRTDLDYQKMHDAFFKLQTKPENITRHGDLYYEGKEYEASVKTRRPGDLSELLVAALNIPPNAPPPWLINMQRYGPPPSYPNLRIPGLNAPIPEGAQWGYHPGESRANVGGWGKPPVDDFNRPLYGDVFGLTKTKSQKQVSKAAKVYWGELKVEYDQEEEESQEEESEDESDQEQKVRAIGGVQEQIQAIESFESGIQTPSGMQSIASGIETPIHVQNTSDPYARQLYKVIPQKGARVSLSGYMGSEHVYDLNSTTVDVSLDAEELELDQDVLRKKLDDATRAGKPVKSAPGQVHQENLSDMVDKHLAGQKRKKEGDTGREKGKKKQFKF